MAKPKKMPGNLVNLGNPTNTVVCELSQHQNEIGKPEEVFVYLTLYEAKGQILTKVYTTQDGEIVKTPAAQMTQGTAERLCIDFKDFLPILQTAKPNQAVGFGIHGFSYPEKVAIKTKGKENSEIASLSRSKDYYHYPKGVGGIAMFDHDPNSFGSKHTADELISIIDSIMPGFRDAAHIVRGSTSSGVHIVGREPIQDGKGFHIYMPVMDASDIPRFGTALFERLWLNGYGFIALAKNGATLVRSVIDAAVFSPERLDFIAPPQIADNALHYSPSEIVYQDGQALNTALLPDLDEQESQTYEALIEKGKKALDPQVQTARHDWMESRILEMTTEGLPEQKARAQVELTASSGFKDLYADFLLEFQVRGKITVTDLLKNPKPFDGKALSDPIEGATYGKSTAKFFWNNGVKPCVNSMAHGGQIYFLHAQTPMDENGNPNFMPSITEMPCYKVTKDYWEDETGKRKPGVYQFIYDPGTEKSPPQIITTWICGPLFLIAITRGIDFHEYGFYLQFINMEGKEHEWQMPRSMLAKPVNDIVEELASRGLEFNMKQKANIAEYLNHSSTHPKKSIWSTDKAGWFEDKPVYILPKRIFGDDADEVVLRGDRANDNRFTAKGTLDEWTNNVARLAVGNDFFLASISQSFVGPLLKICHNDGTAMHFFGGSSIGKTSILKVACSTWGNFEDYKKTWKTTANGLEGAATVFSDGLLCLDEIGDAEPKELSEALYLLLNGVGKNRATIHGTARKSNTWRLAIISNGEKTMEAHCLSKGLTVEPGQLVRFLQIPVKAQHGAFNELHECLDGSEFSHKIGSLIGRYYGTAGPAFLEHLVKADFDEIRQDFDQCVDGFKKRHDNLEAQEVRAAKTFALAAIAGELATAWGITGWSSGDALSACDAMFEHWRNYRGHGDLEPMRVRDAVQKFIETNGDRCFTNHLDGARLTTERAGFWRDDPEGRTWLFSKAGLSKALNGIDFKRGVALLEACGWLFPGNDMSRKTVKVLTKAGDAGTWFYAIRMHENQNIE